MPRLRIHGRWRAQAEMEAAIDSYDEDTGAEGL